MALVQKALFGAGRMKVDLIVDMANLSRRCYERFKDLSYNGKPTGHIYGGVVMLASFARHHGFGKQWRFIFCLEGTAKWRYALHPEYKAGRSKAEKELIQAALNELTGVARHLPGLVLKSKEDEADDLIATHVERNPDRRHLILSNDKDLWQLIDASTDVLLNTTGQAVTLTDVAEVFHTDEPKLVPLTKSILGDASDNLPKVTRILTKDVKLIMERAARPLVQEVIDVAIVLDREGKLDKGTLPKLLEHRDQMEMVLKLATLKRNSSYEESTCVYDEEAVKAILDANGCQSLYDRLGNFIQNQW